MTLLFKAWRESRVRFLVSTAVVALVCLGLLERGTEAVAAQAVRPPYVQLLNIAVLGTPIHTLAFVVLSMLLALGGLQRERAARTAAFTLALPITRGQVVLARAAMGLVQVAALAFLPVLLVPLASALLWQESYPPAQAALFAIRFVSWGAVWFGVSFLWATVIRSEHTAAAAAVLTPFVYMPVYVGILDGERRWPSANYFDFMHGGDSVSRATGAIDGVPWPAVLALAATCVVLLSAALVVARRQEF